MEERPEAVDRVAAAIRSGRTCTHEMPCWRCQAEPSGFDDGGCIYLARLALGAMQQKGL